MKFLQGNCLDKITEQEDNSIDCVVSSPPYYGLRDYGVTGQFGLEKTYQDYIANTVKVFETFKPKLKENNEQEDKNNNLQKKKIEAKTNKEIIDLFGVKNLKGGPSFQSWCRECRNKHSDDISKNNLPTQKKIDL